MTQQRSLPDLREKAFSQYEGGLHSHRKQQLLSAAHYPGTRFCSSQEKSDPSYSIYVFYANRLRTDVTHLKDSEL